MEDTPKTQDSTEYSWQERALKAEAELAKALQKLEYLEAQMRFDPPILGEYLLSVSTITWLPFI
jgi:hypothetical protein